MTKCCWSGCKQKGTCSISYINGEGYLYMCKKCYSDYLKHCDTREDTFREEGKSQARKEFIEMIDKICYSFDGELETGEPKMHRIIAGDKERSWIPRDILLKLLEDKAK